VVDTRSVGVVRLWRRRKQLPGSGSRVQGSLFSVQGSGFRFQVSRFRVQGSGFRVQCSGFRVHGSGFRVQGVSTCPALGILPALGGYSSTLSLSKRATPCLFICAKTVKAHRLVQRFQGGLVFKAHRLLYHSTLGARVIKKKKKRRWGMSAHQTSSGGGMQDYRGASPIRNTSPP